MLLPFITPDSNDLTSTHYILFNNQNPPQDHKRRSLHSRIRRARIARRNLWLVRIHSNPTHHRNISQRLCVSSWNRFGTNLFLESSLAS